MAFNVFSEKFNAQLTSKERNLSYFIIFFISEHGLIISHRRLVPIQWGYWFISQALVILSFLKIQPLWAGDGTNPPPHPIPGECPPWTLLPVVPLQPAAREAALHVKHRLASCSHTLQAVSIEKLALKTDRQPPNRAVLSTRRWLTAPW